jgi:hypothetical protein
MRNRLILFVLFVGFLVLQPTTSSAACTEADLNRAASVSPQAWIRACQQCGGRVTKGANNRCEGWQQSSSKSGTSGSGVDVSTMASTINSALRQREEEVHQQHREAMQNLDTQNRSRLSNEEQQIDQARDEKLSKEEQRRKDALSRMGGSPADSGIARMDFDDYRQRQAERAAALKENKEERKLSKKEQDWCKVQAPYTAQAHPVSPENRGAGRRSDGAV